METNLIYNELKRRPICSNPDRNCGNGRSMALGVVNRRSSPTDYSRHCWKRPELYRLVMDFAESHFPDFPYTSITVNQCFQCLPHRDKGNIGDSIVVAFGSYTGGELIIHEGLKKGKHDICNKPIQDDFKQNLHSVAPFEGDRFSLVYYTVECDVPPPSIRDGKFYRGDVQCKGLPHPKWKNQLKMA